MADFVHTADGEINVRFIRRIVDGYGSKPTRIFTDDGESYQLDHGEEVPRGTIVPAILPLTLLEIYYCPHDGGDDPFSIFRQPIIAWRICDDGYPIPIAVGCPEHKPDCQFVELPDGSYQRVGYEGEGCTTLDAVREVVKREYEGKHPSEGAAR